MTLAAFAAAGAFGIVATFLWSYQVAATATLREMLTARWQWDEVDARNAVATADLATTESLRRGNNWKSRLLIAALAFQVLGLVTLTWGVYRILQAAG